jgi:hypothetical protein
MSNNQGSKRHESARAGKARLSRSLTLLHQHHLHDQKITDLESYIPDANSRNRHGADRLCKLFEKSASSPEREVKSTVFFTTIV